MEVSISRREGVTVVNIAGSVDTFTSEHLGKTFAKLIGEGQTKLIANLKETDFEAALLNEAWAQAAEHATLQARTPVVATRDDAVARRRTDGGTAVGVGELHAADP